MRVNTYAAERGQAWCLIVFNLAPPLRWFPTCNIEAFRFEFFGGDIPKSFLHIFGLPFFHDTIASFIPTSDRCEEAATTRKDLTTLEGN